MVSLRTTLTLFFATIAYLCAALFPVSAGICIGTAEECGAVKTDTVNSGTPKNPFQPVEQTIITPDDAASSPVKRIALVIGNSAYKQAAALRTPNADAKAMADKLGTLGFYVILVVDGDYSKMGTAVSEFIIASRDAQVSVFYYSGHASQLDSVNYLLPVDFVTDEARTDTKAIRMQEMVNLLSSKIRIFILDACRNNPFAPASRAVEQGLAAVFSDHDTVFAYATAPGAVAYDGTGDHSPFTSALLTHIAEPDITVESMFKRVSRQVYLETDATQRPWIESSMLEDFYFVSTGSASRPSSALAAPTISIADELIDSLTNGPVKLGGLQGVVNGGLVSLDDADSPVLRPGLHLLEQAGRSIRVWYESKTLASFTEPYKRSYAIIVSLDYVQPQVSGFKPLGKMVETADRLADELVVLGFPPGNIIKLYDKAATSTAIDETLREFWQGGQYEDADRLVVYFGGHGSYVDLLLPGGKLSRRGLLVTSNFDRSRLTSTSVLMDDIVSRHGRYITANHVAFFIDACSSGLSLPEFLDGEDAERLRANKRLAVIRAETTSAGRDILVAGTSDERARYDDGPLFSEALIVGLKGWGDLNGDRLVSFDELSTYVRTTVVQQTEFLGVRQRPADFKTGANVLFLLPP